MRIWIALLALAVASCATVQSKTEYDRTADFSRYRTFKILRGTIIHSDTGVPPNTLAAERLRAEMAAQLTAEGLTRTDADTADLFVGFVGGARTQEELVASGPYDTLMGPYMSPGYWGPRTWSYQNGTLVIDIVDGASKKMVWRSVLTSDQEQLSDFSNPKLIHEAVSKAFASYPPRS